MNATKGEALVIWLVFGLALGMLVTATFFFHREHQHNLEYHTVTIPGIVQ